MAQWSHSDRALYAKVVYYGPALGGKTTNLRLLHRITDPEGATRLLSLATADDRTLFFDLLPFDLGNVLGHRLALKVYTVPGQVRYDATRRIVLSGADAVVFVADSRRGREHENRSSFENLRLNMRANRLDPATVPVLFQFNKQDLEDRATPAEVAAWFGIDEAQGFPAVATDGRGVLDTFVAATKAMLGRLAALADAKTRRLMDPAEIARHVDRAFAGLAPPAGPPRETGVTVLEGKDLLGDAVRTGIELGAELAEERGRALRLEREADALRRLSESMLAVGASLDRATVVRAALGAVRDALEAAAASLVVRDPAGRAFAEAVEGRAADPLLERSAGRGLIERLLASGAPRSVEDLAAELDGGKIPGIRGLAAAPFGAGRGGGLLLAYAAEERRGAGEGDVRFLSTLAGQLAVGLENARAHAELARRRDQLETQVAARTRALRRAYDELRALERTKDRFLSGLSHEMRSPLTVVVSAASFLRDYEAGAGERREMTSAILAAASTLERLLDNLFRVARLDGDVSPSRRARTLPAEIVGEALRLAGHPEARVVVNPAAPPVDADPERLARAVANLVENAVKFSPAGSTIEVRATPCTLGRGSGAAAGLSIAVLDRGPGIADGDRERVFLPFEQGGDPLTGKPRGVGLGLYEASTIVRRHGGSLHHAPRAGGGSEFRVVLPAAAPKEEAVG